MTRAGWALLLVAAWLGILLAVLLTRDPDIDARDQRERATADSIAGAALDDLARVQRQAMAWEDSATAHRQQADSFKASADQKAARIAYSLAHPKIISYSVTPGYAGPPLPDRVDSAASCEEW